MDTISNNGAAMNGAEQADAEYLVPIVSVDELTVIFEGLAPGVYRYAGRVGNTAMQRWAQARGWQAWHINGANITDKADLLAAVKRAMHLPTWFGSNWDALDETLRDLEGQRAEGYLLIYDHPSALANGDPAAWQMFLDLLGGACAFWQEQGQSFYVILRHTRGAAPEIPLLR